MWLKLFTYRRAHTSVSSNGFCKEVKEASEIAAIFGCNNISYHFCALITCQALFFSPVHTLTHLMLIISQWSHIYIIEEEPKEERGKITYPRKPI